jgi:hypothetical protein
MKNTLLVLYVTSLFTAIAVPAHAQSGSGMKLHGNIPFEFSLGDKPLPAGEYYIETRESRDSVRFLSADRQSVRSTNSNPITKFTEQQRPRLVFREYGKETFLSEIWSTYTKREFPMSRAERELARTTNSTNKTLLMGMKPGESAR